MSVDQQRFEKGIAIRKSLGMHVTPGPNVDDGFFAHTAAELFGTVFTRPGLALRDREVVTLAVIIAIGGSAENLSNHLRAVIALGISDGDIKEIIVQTMYYAGWPRGAAANQLYNKIKSERGIVGAPSPAAAKPGERSAEGRRIRAELGMDRAPADLDDEFVDLTLSEWFGGVFARPGLNLRHRTMITLAAMIALGAAPDLLAEQFRAAQAMGFSDEEVREIIVQAMYYCGWPRGAAANQVYNRLAKP